MDLELIKRVGIKAAFRGGEILRAYIGKIKDIRKKGSIDLVTEADTACEKVLIEIIREKFADHSILAEESGLNNQSSIYQWIIDPLDGTTNFAHQLNLFSISIGFAIEKEIVVGIVLNPMTGELFSAIKGKGAYLNNNQIKVSEILNISESLLVTGFPYDLKQNLDTLIKRFSKCIESSQGVRRLGSASLDLCFVACGRFEGFWEQNLKPWDTAAGILIVCEAGGVITDFSNQPYNIYKKEILSTNGKIHNELLSLLS